MSDTSWHSVEELFELCLPLAAAQREAFLRERCAADPALVAEVLALLAHDEAAPETFLTPMSASEAFVEDEVDPRLGTRVGRYTIRSFLGAGGMGRVYLAEQEHPPRLVALKVLPPGVDISGLCRRFDHESQILAHLQHPHIAEVYEAGVHFDAENGTAIPYFALEFVQGARNLLDFAAQEQLGARERLALFVQVCEAVHHGHQKGVIHRDLKPANILVNSAGQVKVIDFGVARATDADIALTSMRTAAGELIGTPLYMSPEQCDGDANALDTRSDVYSLGVVLYELMTQRLPYEAGGTTIYSIIRSIKEQIPTLPSARDRRLRGNIEGILLKALEKGPEKRYQSAADLGQDITRHLAGDPISARPPSRWSRLARWIGRHPAATTVATCAGLGLSALALTLLAVWWSNQQPYRVEVDGRHSARLLARNGRTLQRWPAATRPGEPYVNAAQLLPADAGGGALVLVAFAVHPDLGACSGRLAAFDPRVDPGRPRWLVGITDDDLPDDMRALNRSAAMCSPTWFCPVDVFPSRPGSEIVAAYSLGPHSQRALCIFDRAGRPLYRAWQDGGIYDMHWMAAAGLLIGLASEERMKEAAQRAHPDFSGPTQLMVFALRPVEGQLSNGYLATALQPGPVKPVWLRYVWPLFQQDQRALHLRAAQFENSARNIDPGSFVELSLSLALPEDGGEFGFTIVIDSQGREVRDKRIVTDSYRPLFEQGLVPAENVFSLHEEPAPFPGGH